MYDVISFSFKNLSYVFEKEKHRDQLRITCTMDFRGLKGKNKLYTYTHIHSRTQPIKKMATDKSSEILFFFFKHSKRKKE